MNPSKVRAEAENDQAIAALTDKLVGMLSDETYERVCKLVFSHNGRAFQRRLASVSASERDRLLSIALAAMQIGFTQAVARLDEVHLS